MNAVKLVDSLTRVEQREVFYELARRLFPNTKIEGVTTPLLPWLKENRKKFNNRVFQGLYDSGFSFVEEINKEGFMPLPGLGETSWKQFKKIRGY